MQSPFYGQTWFLSIVSGLLAVVLYHFCAPRAPTDTSDDTSTGMQRALQNVNTKMLLGVFLVVALLVYGSFMIADATGACRFIDVQPDIQTGGRPPF